MKVKDVDDLESGISRLFPVTFSGGRADGRTDVRGQSTPAVYAVRLRRNGCESE